MAWDCREIVRTVIDFRALMGEAKTLYNALKAEEQEADRAFSDIYHYCELKYPTDPKKRTKVCQLMREWGERRRKAKDGIAILTPLVEFLEKKPTLDNELGKVANGMKSHLRQIEGARKYNPRVIRELFEEGNGE